MRSPCPAQRPRFVVPHQPRIDWMLWFVPMSPVFLDWFERYLKRIAEGSPAVTATLARPPPAGAGPLRLRVSVYRYRFATPEERKASGAWWLREYLGPFMPLPYLEEAG